MDFLSMGQTLASDSGVEVQLVAPDGFTRLYAVEKGGKWSLTTDAEAKGAEPCRVFVTGQDSRAYRRRKHELVDAIRKHQNTIRAAQIETESLKLVAAGVTGWQNIPWEGELLEFSDENLLRFLDVYRPAFDQLDKFIGDRANFMKLD